MRSKAFTRGAGWGRPRFAAALWLTAALAAPVHAANLCGWFVETVDAHGQHNVALWLQSNERITFEYAMTGKGFYDGDGGAEDLHPSGSTYALEPGKAESVASSGSTVDPGMHIDFGAEIHASKRDIFDNADSPLLGKFAYQRTVTAGAEKPPAGAPHACFDAIFPDPQASN